MLNLLLILLVLYALHVEGAEEMNRVDGSKVMFIVLSQPNSYHVQRATEFQKHFDSQILKLNEKPELYLLHQKWTDDGAWTIFPILKNLQEEFGDKHWVVFCEEETRIDVKRLLGNLNRYDHKEELYLGRGLADREMVIIHHFKLPPPGSNFTYPDFAAGMVFSMALVKSGRPSVSPFIANKEIILGRGLADRHPVVIHHYTRPDPKYRFMYPDTAAGMAITMALIKRIVQRMNDEKLKMNFAIDAKHELAWLIFNNGKGPVMQNVTFMCTNKVTPDCVTQYTQRIPECGDPVPDDDLFFAVKTCEKYHTERIPIVKRTWFTYAQHIEFYSETADPSIPTLDLGVPNTERGHCGKLEAILKRAYNEEHIKNRKWLVIADDDTLLCIPRLRQLLTCYNSSEAVALGERYGYSVLQDWGYNYITGGGSMVLSMEAVRRIISCKPCRCNDIQDPDDMFLGMWLKRLGIPVTHSPLFHQARAADYAPEYLAHQDAVSFHKFWNNDPLVDYRIYLMHITQHDEL